MKLSISKITLVGLLISLAGIVMQIRSGAIYSINGVDIFPFVIIPIGVLISLLGFIKKGP